MTDDLKERWWVWHKDNPEFYALFKRFTFEAIRKGHRRLSAWLIVNRIRWETMIVTTGRAQFWNNKHFYRKCVRL